MRELTREEERLVWQVARYALRRYLVKLPDMQRRSLDEGAMLMAGLEGAIRAVRSYQPNKKASLNTWIFSGALGYIQHEGRFQYKGKHSDYAGRTRAAKWVSLDFETEGGKLLERSEFQVDGPDRAYDSPVADELGKLDQWLTVLDERERHILRWRFTDGWSQVRVAEELGMSQMNVSRIERQALAKLRERYCNER